MINSKILYFGSSNPNIKEIYKGKFLTTFKSIACCFAIDLNDVYQENKRYYSINWGYDQWNKSEKYLNKQLIPDLIKITNNAIDWIPTAGNSTGYLYSINVDDYVLNHLETFNDSDPKWEVVYNGEKCLPVTLIECVELNWTCEYSKLKSDRCGFALETPVYERPWTYDEIKQHYGKFVADKLSNDPCHKWRMETGIELIHKEPDFEEQKRIWKNWQLMSDENKQISDEKCIELFGMTNSRLHEFILKNNWNNPKHLRSKFNQIYEQVMTTCENKYKLFEVNRSLLPKNNYPFNNFINRLLLEDYHIFPVPKDLLNDIENFVITNNTFAEKHYTISDILNLTTNWEYYAEFNENLELMLKQNINCKIVCCVFNTKFDVLKILEKYPTNASIDNIFNLKAFVYSYDENDGSTMEDENSDFNICLCINKHINKQKIKKAVQHELIHWMQVTLNSETHKTFRFI